jgi:phytoene synthase
MGRRYLPLERDGVRLLEVPDNWLPTRDWAQAHPAKWTRFLEGHLTRYAGWQAEAEAGYSFIPWRPRVAVRTAADMYNWTARQIEADPFVIFERKVKPAKKRILFQALWNGLRG